MSRSSRRLVWNLAVASLVLLATFEAPSASLRSVWRYVVLSFDSPATQMADELLGESSPTSRAGAEAAQSTRLAVQRGGSLVSLSRASRRADPALGSGITRAPPSV
jgi:hypothetical protein